ncbi:MAG: hypothetical protein L0Y71_02970 [Gemmataceae bacterium]|nr:hypothetical protein [Gemmataceae bacterium]
MICRIRCLVVGLILLPGSLATSHEPKNQDEALAVLRKIDGKATFDPAHPKRVIGVDI